MIYLALLNLLIWICLTFFWHGFWRSNQILPQKTTVYAPSVAIIVPARNEVKTIATVVKHLAAQNYQGSFHIMVVDDSSTDGTGQLAQSAGATVIHTPALPLGWSGKLWALHNGVLQSQSSELFWFTDADIIHKAGTLSAMVAQIENKALVSVMVQLRCLSFWERLLVPGFIYFFTLLYPFPAVNNPASKLAGAAGGSILLRRDALERIGGIESYHNTLIDDCALAKRVKVSGGNLWLGLSDMSLSLRQANTLAPLWNMIKRTAFTQLRYNPMLLLGTVFGLILTFLVAPALLISQWHAQKFIALLAAASWLLMIITYIPTLKRYQQSAMLSVFLPITAIFYMLMTLDSAIAHWFGRGSNWKGRAYVRSKP